VRSFWRRMGGPWIINVIHEEETSLMHLFEYILFFITARKIPICVILIKCFFVPKYLPHVQSPVSWSLSTLSHSFYYLPAASSFSNTKTELDTPFISIAQPYTDVVLTILRKELLYHHLPMVSDTLNLNSDHIRWLTSH